MTPNIRDVLRQNKKLKEQLEQAEQQISGMQEAIESAATKIRRCDYTMARSDLLVAIANTKGAAA